MVTKDDYNLNYTLKRLKNSNMLPHNRHKATEYYEEKIAQGARKISYSYVLRILIELGETFKAKKFEDVSKQELISFFNNLKPKDNVLKTRHGAIITIPIKSYSKNTLWQYKASVKTFYRWLFGKESDETPPEAVRWIKRIGNKNGDSWDKLKKEIITPKEATRILKAAKNARNKAIVAILWEYGLRASELLNMKKSDLKIRENYIEFEVNGKTGKRGVILVESKPFLEAWLAELEEKKSQLPETVWDINTDQFIQRIIYFKDPHFSRGSSLNKKEFQVIPKVIRNYLKLVSRSVLLRNEKWLEHNAEDLYPDKAKKGKEKMLWYLKNFKEHTRFEKLTLEDLAELFIEYLLVNRNTPKLKSKQGQEEILRLMERYHLSNDSRYLRDVELENVRPRLIIADKKAKH